MSEGGEKGPIQETMDVSQVKCLLLEVEVEAEIERTEPIEDSEDMQGSRRDL
jgi:hypothetical protein